jgi:dTDP-glucose 4,6-dehydratase
MNRAVAEMSKKRKIKHVLVTGGCGFIGSNFIRYLFEKSGFRGTVVNVDKLTYAGNPDNLHDIALRYGNKRYFYEKTDISDYPSLQGIFEKYPLDTVIHFAAESHVDRSIFGPSDFIQSNILGTFTLLEVVRKAWAGKKQVLFHHISTDEVYGSLGDTGYFQETTAYNPRNPYSASKAASDHLVKAYFHTYSLPITLSNCSNNYGPCQFPEKLIPLLTLNAWKGKPLPIYGDGQHIRDWLYVEDHCSAIWTIIHQGQAGETYNIGGDCEMTNLQVVEKICETLEALYPIKTNLHVKLLKSKIQNYKDLMTFVSDRPGHDRRYAIDFEKIRTELKWEPRVSFDSGLEKTIQWYLKNEDWINNIISGEYRNWTEKNYRAR